MKQQHHPHDIKTYEKGINSDTNKEILGSSEGEHVDALNMRSLPMDGDNSAKKKIKGEVTLYPNIDNRCIGGTGEPLNSGYVCMLSLEVNNHIIEMYAHPTPESNLPLMRIDGKIVMMSEDLPIDVEHPLQYDKNETCTGGEIYITNNNTPPLVFSVKDIMNNSGLAYMSETDGLECTLKYFDEFNVDEYTVRISSALNKMFFIQQDSSTTLFPYTQVFGTLGVPVGYYSYSYRFTTEDGDRSSWSPVTEMIPVLQSFRNTGDSIFPAIGAYSSEPDISSPSGYGNHLRVRLENFNSFNAIEVRRDAWYAGDPLGNPPTTTIIGIMEIIEGVSVVDILDRAGADEIEEIVTVSEQSDSLTGIQRAKAIRYYNSQLYLMNIGYASKDIDNQVEFDSETDNVFPTIQKIGKTGHKNPYNATHFKANMRGDVAGFGVVLFDQDGNMSYAKKVDGAESFMFPNRRENVSSETLGTSYEGLVRSSNVNGSVDYTHEVFDHIDAESKSGRMISNISTEPTVNIFNQDFTYRPMTPVSQSDSGSDNNHDLSVNLEVKLGLSEWKSYAPKAFGLNYYSMGVAMKGLTMPDWAVGFSVVQTESVKRVVAQGLGWYSMGEAEDNSGARGTKSVNKAWCYFPDFDAETGLYPSLAQDVLDKPQNYKAQLVAPLGFFTEVYSFFNKQSPPPFYQNRSTGTDLITYCRVIRDNGEINPDGNNISPIQEGSVKYVGYGANIQNVPPAVFPSNGNGNNVFEISDISELQTSSTLCKYFEITFGQSIYSRFNTSGASVLEWNQQGVRDFLEPMYVVNIIREEAQVLDLNTTQYNYTGHYVKKESLLGISDGQEFRAQLVSERWEDCVPRLNGHNSSFSDYEALARFVFVEDELGQRRRWLNVSYYSDADIDTILNELTTNGVYTVSDSSGSYSIYGVYKHEEIGIGSHTEVRLVFEHFSNAYDIVYMVPSNEYAVYVNYDKRIPVRVFGGDTWINESIWSPIDNEYTKGADPINDEHKFIWDIPMPFGGYRLSDDMIIIKNSPPTANRTQNEKDFQFQQDLRASYIRQWVTMWTAETRTNLSFAFNDEGQKHNLEQFFPLKNYVVRPYQWKDDEFSNGATEVYNDNNIDGQYEDDYGDEYINWIYGGFRFKPRTNIDYSKRNKIQLITTTPKVGFVEQTDFCTRIAWSETRPINSQFTPTVRTFPSGNYYDLPDNTGEIKFGWSALSSSKGNNLYALTNDGVAMLLIDKRILHEINANELATIGSDIGGILNHIWIDTSIGMKGETWRSWAEYSNLLFFHNGSSAYLLTDNQLTDITVGGWKEMYKQRIAPYIGSGYSTKLSGVFNTLTKEYIANLDKSSLSPNSGKFFSVPQTVIYGLGQQALQCRSTYDYEKYLSFSDRLYGMKGMVTYELGIGNQLNGEDIECFVTNVSDKELYSDKEFIRIRVNSNSKPSHIYFYDSYEDYLNNNYTSVVDASSSAVAIKDYHGYECYIPRKEAFPHDRQQGRAVLFRVVSSDNEDFLVSSTGVQYKVLK